MKDEQEPEQLSVEERRAAQAAKRLAQFDNLRLKRKKDIENGAVFKRKLSYMENVSELVFMLLGADMTCKELAKDLGMHISTVRQLIACFRETPGIIFISGWQERSQGSHPVTPIYTMRRIRGDVPRPEPISRAEIQRRQRAKRKRLAAIKNGSASAVTNMVEQLQSAASSS